MDLSSFLSNLTKYAVGAAGSPLSSGAMMIYDLLGGEENANKNVTSLYNLYNNWSNSGEINDMQGFMERLNGSMYNMSKPASQSLEELLMSSNSQQALNNINQNNDYYTANDLQSFMDINNASYYSQPYQNLMNENSTNEILSKILG